MLTASQKRLAGSETTGWLPFALLDTLLCVYYRRDLVFDVGSKVSAVLVVDAGISKVGDIVLTPKDDTPCTASFSTNNSSTGISSSYIDFAFCSPNPKLLSLILRTCIQSLSTAAMEKMCIIHIYLFIYS